MDIRAWKKSPSIEYVSDVKQIVDPILTDFNLTYFNLFRSYYDGSFFMLSNRGDWVEYFYKSNFIELGAFEQNPKLYTPTIVLWNGLTPNKVTDDAKEKFNISNGITLSESYEKYIDFYHFGTTCERIGVINFYVNQLPLLKKFIFYFKDKARKLIELSAKQSISYKKRCEQIIDIYASLYDLNKLRQQMSNLQVKRFYIGDNYLTRKEMDVCSWLYQNKSVEEIAMILSMSKRTCDVHIDNIKAKLDCHKQSQLVQRFAELRVFG